MPGFVIVNLDDEKKNHVLNFLLPLTEIEHSINYRCRQQTAVEFAVPEILSLLNSQIFSYHAMLLQISQNINYDHHDFKLGLLLAPQTESVT